MSVRVGINGFGRMGRLALRAGWGAADLEFVHVNEVRGGPETAAHLLTFDSVHGRWPRDVRASARGIEIDDAKLSFSEHAAPGDVPWGELGVDIVLECSGIPHTGEPRAYFESQAQCHCLRAVQDKAARTSEGSCHAYQPDDQHLPQRVPTTACPVSGHSRGLGIRHGLTPHPRHHNTQTVATRRTRTFAGSRAACRCPTTTGLPRDRDR